MEKSDARSKQPILTESVKLQEDSDIPYLIGREGLIRQKIARASGCELEMFPEELRLEIRGEKKQIRLAATMVRYKLANKDNTEIEVDLEGLADCCSVLDIPADTGRLVVGKGGQHANQVETDACCMIFFGGRKDGKVVTVDDLGKATCLLIFGNRRARRHGQLFIMSFLETIYENFYSKRYKESGELYENAIDLKGDWATDVREIETDQIKSLLIGARGSTMKKIAKASGCIVKVVGDLIFMSGAKFQRSYANDYVNWMIKQATDMKAESQGTHFKYTVEASAVEGRKDCTLVHVPEESVAYVTGARRATLGILEEELGVFVLACAARKEDFQGETFAIFGPTRARVGAELSIMNLCEKLNPGHFEKRIVEKKSTADAFARDYMQLDDQTISYVMGKKGMTIKKIETASNAIVRNIGLMVAIAGTREERQCCRDYIEWLLKQMDKMDGNGAAPRIDAKNRSDVTEMYLTRDQIRALMTDRSASLREIEQESGTFMFFAEDLDGVERLLIAAQEKGSPFGFDKGRAKAERLVTKALLHEERSGGAGRWSSDGGKGGGKGGGKWSDQRNDRWNDSGRDRNDWGNRGRDSWNDSRGGGGSSWSDRNRDDGRGWSKGGGRDDHGRGDWAKGGGDRSYGGYGKGGGGGGSAVRAFGGYGKGGGGDRDDRGYGGYNAKGKGGGRGRSRSRSRSRSPVAWRRDRDHGDRDRGHGDRDRGYSDRGGRDRVDRGGDDRGGDSGGRKMTPPWRR